MPPKARSRANGSQAEPSHPAEDASRAAADATAFATPGALPSLDSESLKVDKPDAEAAADMTDAQLAWRLHQELNAGSPILRTRSRKVGGGSGPASGAPSAGHQGLEHEEDMDTLKDTAKNSKTGGKDKERHGKAVEKGAVGGKGGKRAAGAGAHTTGENTGVSGSIKEEKGSKETKGMDAATQTASPRVKRDTHDEAAGVVGVDSGGGAAQQQPQHKHRSRKGRPEAATEANALPNGSSKPVAPRPAKPPKIPNLPMVKHSKKWYRARVLKETAEKVQIEFTGFEHMMPTVWLPKMSDRIWFGSYKGKDWKYLGEGAWEPKNGIKNRIIPGVIISAFSDDDERPVQDGADRSGGNSNSGEKPAKATGAGGNKARKRPAANGKANAAHVEEEDENGDDMDVDGPAAAANAVEERKRGKKRQASDGQRGLRSEDAKRVRRGAGGAEANAGRDGGNGGNGGRGRRMDPIVREAMRVAEAEHGDDEADEEASKAAKKPRRRKDGGAGGHRDGEDDDQGHGDEKRVGGGKKEANSDDGNDNNNTDNDDDDEEDDDGDKDDSEHNREESEGRHRHGGNHASKRAAVASAEEHVEAAAEGAHPHRGRAARRGAVAAIAAVALAAEAEETRRRRGRPVGSGRHLHREASYSDDDEEDGGNAGSDGSGDERNTKRQHRPRRAARRAAIYNESEFAVDEEVDAVEPEHPGWYYVPVDPGHAHGGGGALAAALQRQHDGQDAGGLALHGNGNGNGGWNGQQGPARRRRKPLVASPAPTDVGLPVDAEELNALKALAEMPSPKSLAAMRAGLQRDALMAAAAAGGEGKANPGPHSALAASAPLAAQAAAQAAARRRAAPPPAPVPAQQQQQQPQHQQQQQPPANAPTPAHDRRAPNHHAQHPRHLHRKPPPYGMHPPSQHDRHHRPASAAQETPRRQRSSSPGFPTHGAAAVAFRRAASVDSLTTAQHMFGRLMGAVAARLGGRGGAAAEYSGMEFERGSVSHMRLFNNGWTQHRWVACADDGSLPAILSLPTELFAAALTKAAAHQHHHQHQQQQEQHRFANGTHLPPRANSGSASGDSNGSLDVPTLAHGGAAMLPNGGVNSAGDSGVANGAGMLMTGNGANNNESSRSPSAGVEDTGTLRAGGQFVGGAGGATGGGTKPPVPLFC